MVWVILESNTFVGGGRGWCLMFDPCWWRWRVFVVTWLCGWMGDAHVFVKSLGCRRVFSIDGGGGVEPMVC